MSRAAALAEGAQCGANVAAMDDKRLFEDLSARINEALRNSPAQDIEKNLRAMLASWFDRMDLVMREDFEVQKKLLERALSRLAELEGRVAQLESARNKPPT
jgi:ubiquinone biosynthesis accessory factor UbiK